MKKVLPFLYLTVVFLLFFSFYACNKEKLKAKIPAYIHIDTVFVSSNYATQGSNSNKITDVWLTIDGKSYGTYPLPATIPINLSGTQHLNIKAGIKANGISNTRKIYPFYTKYLDTLDLKPNEDYTIIPNFSYHSSTKLKWMEDFESAGIDFNYLNTSNIKFSKVSQPEAFEGGFSGYVKIDQTHPFVEAHSSAISHFNRSSPTFLELNYKCSHSFKVGFYYDKLVPNNQISVLTITPKDKWNKIYVDLSNAISRYPYSKIYIFIGAKLNSGETEAEIYLDNIKLVQAE